MDRERKLQILADSAKYDASCASSGAARPSQAGGIGSTDGTGICHSYTPDGRCVSLLKILLTNFCHYDCLYCVNRVSNDVERARFSVEEVVRLTLDFYKRNYIEGLFLSSGIIQSPDYTLEQMIAAARALREQHGFGGYIHLKLIPGADQALVHEAGRWADRLSANMEIAVERELVRFAPEKRHAIVEHAMRHIRDRVEEHADGRRTRAAPAAFAPAGQSTQLIVGAGDESDTEILSLSSRLYNRYGLRRVYYSGYSPYASAHPLLPAAAPPLIREHRLYQADWLTRYYGFDASELTTPAEPNLNLHRDPKLSWALRHPEYFPVDINVAPRERLLRIPGIGRRNVDRVLRIRRHHRLTLEDLGKLRISTRKVRPFVIADGFASGRPPGQAAAVDGPREAQLSLFDAASVLSGEL
jgi:putative DNA modification/repair radical SAM protein